MKTINRQDLITAPFESRFQIDIEKNWVESCKVTLLLNELENLRSSGSKSIVFSQWTAFLDLLQIPFTRNNISFVRLEGTLNMQQREKVIKQFSEDSDTQVLLMSLKAGGMGINLTAASNAFVMALAALLSTPPDANSALCSSISTHAPDNHEEPDDDMGDGHLLDDLDVEEDEDLS